MMRDMFGFPKSMWGFHKKNVHRRVIQREREGNVSLMHTRTFHIKKKLIERTILSTIGPREVVYGEQSLKAHFPPYLRRYTQDYDVYSPTPRKDAVQCEKALDHKFGGNFFYVKPAMHKGTYKVVAFANEEGYADFTKKPDDIKFDTIKGVKYSRLDREKKNRMKSLKDKEFEFRHGKDRDALNRIKIYEKNK